MSRREALNMNIIMGTGFVVPLLRSSSFARSWDSPLTTSLALYLLFLLRSPLLLFRSPLFRFASTPYACMCAHVRAHVRTNARVKRVGSHRPAATTTKRDVSLYLLNCLLAPGSTPRSFLPRVSLMSAEIRRSLSLLRA